MTRLSHHRPIPGPDLHNKIKMVACIIGQKTSLPLDRRQLTRKIMNVL